MGKEESIKGLTSTHGRLQARGTDAICQGQAFHQPRMFRLWRCGDGRGLYISTNKTSEWKILRTTKAIQQTKKDKDEKSTDFDQKNRNHRGKEEVYIFGTKI